MIRFSMSGAERGLRRSLLLILFILSIIALVFPSSAVSGDTGAGKKLICITFDDGWQNQYDNALPVLQQYGFKATFAVVTTWIGEGSGNGECMDYTELHTLADQGMDIASHTRTHAHLPNVDAVKLQNEVAGSKTELESENLTVRMLVYPYYEYNDSVIASAKNAGYLCARSGARPNPYDPADRTDPDAQYKIDAIEINTQDLDTFKGIVDQATDRSVICLCYHSVSDAGVPTPCTPVANFSDQMNYLKNNGFTVALLPDLVQTPWITCSPASLGFSGMQGGSVPATQILNISNSGGGTLTWAASSSATWLTLSASAGTAPGAVTIAADTTGLSEGIYDAAITISAPDAANTPQAVPVTLTVQASSPGWLNGWSYRKQITVAGSSAGAQTNYPMRLTVNRSTGADSGATVYLGSKCADDYRDLRFTGYDGSTLFDYWIESCTSSTATVWIELDSIPASPATSAFNLYYGNSGAASVSNMKNTFTFGDDFDDGSLDATSWGSGGGGTITESGGLLTVQAGSSDQEWASSINTYGNSYALHTRARLDSITDCTSYRLIGFVATRGSYADKLFTTAHRWYYPDANFVAVSGDGSGYAQINMAVPVNTDFNVSECRRYAASSANYDRFIMGNGAAVNGTKPTATARYIYINSDEYSKAIIVDWIFLRKFVSIEPTWSGWGSEETSGTPQPPSIAFSPASLTFSGVQGGTNPTTQALNISNSGGGTLNWTASSDAAWLTVSPTGGAAPGTVTITTAISGLSADTYNGTITITATGATNTPQTVPVTLTVQAPPSAPAIVCAPASLTFSGTQGGSNPATKSLNISNSGGGTLNWAASSDVAWLTLSPTGGAAPGMVTVTADISGLSADVYNGIITIAATDATNTPQTVPVTLTVEPQPAAIACSPAGLTFNGIQGGGNPAIQALNISNSGGGTLNWTVSSDAAWLTVSPTGGTAPGTVTITTAISGLSADTYNGTITITATGATNTPQTVPVTLTVSISEPGAPTLSSPANGAKVSGTSYTFKWAAGTGSPTKYQLQVNSNSSFTGTSYFSGQVTTTSKLVTGLPNNGATLYWRVCACNAAGWGPWSSVWNFINDSSPTVSTYGHSQLTATSVRLIGDLTSLGSASAVKVSFMYGTTTACSGGTSSTKTFSAPIHFGIPLSGLSPGTTYYYKAKAVGNGTGYGSVLNFTTTGGTTPPTVTTYGYSQRTTTSVRLIGDLTSLGSASSVKVSFMYGTTTACTGGTSSTKTFSAPVHFGIPVSGLSPGTTYYYKARAVGSGTSYGSVMSFTTAGGESTALSVSTYGHSQLTSTSVRLIGDLSNLGSASSVNVSFTYGTTTDCSGGTSSTKTFSAPVHFGIPVSGLSPGTTYYYKAKAMGSGTSYGSVMSFTTLH